MQGLTLLDAQRPENPDKVGNEQSFDLIRRGIVEVAAQWQNLCSVFPLSGFIVL